MHRLELSVYGIPQYVTRDTQNRRWQLYKGWIARNNPKESNAAGQSRQTLDALNFKAHLFQICEPEGRF